MTQSREEPGLPVPVRITALPETERAVEEVLTIPCYPSMTDDDVDRVCRAPGEASAG